ncbi:MAG: DUF3426 domain-containing protein [Candidatus Thiodiazotropha sp.]
MLTQCPHCLTMFRITPEQLKAAEGRVRCCQCNQVFNALQRLQEFPKPFDNPSASSNLMDGGQMDAELLESFESQLERPDSTLINDSEVERSLDDLADDSALVETSLAGDSGLIGDSNPAEPPLSEDSNLEDDQRSLTGDSQSQLLYEQDDGLETEPEYFAAGTESQMSELLDQDSASLLLSDDDLPQSNLAEIIELDIPQAELRRSSDLPQSEPDSPGVEAETTPASQPEPVPSRAQVEQSETGSTPPKQEHERDDLFDDLDHPFDFEPSDEELRRRRNNRLWLLGALLLLVPLAGQIAWQMRDRLIYHDTGRLFLNTLCDVTGCSVPLRRATDKIVIVQRALTAHPSKPDLLLMQLEIVNTAPFSQPYPKLQLSLFNEMEKLIARRTFNPEEYLDIPAQQLPLLTKQTATHITLELVDPGSEVTGFKFDFL